MLMMKLIFLEILSYQDRHDLSNNEISKRFKLSRNTISRWKKAFKHVILRITNAIQMY